MALLTVALLLFLTNPELLEEIWLWVVGFIGYIVLLLERGFQAVANIVKPKPKVPIASPSDHASPTFQLPPRFAELENKLQQQEQANPSYPESTITILRYLDDGNTSLGLIFFRKKFFAYTLEDTHQLEKVAGQTRIPPGTYQLSFRQQDTPLTISYRKRFPWFTYHLELKEVPEFNNIYIHIGNTHRDTEGCILIADGVNATSPGVPATDKMIIHSQLAFERLYKKISALLTTDEVVTVRILDETWFAQAQLQPV